MFAQRIGLTLEEIGAELAKLPADRSPTRRDWARLSGAWTKRVDQMIAQLQRLRDGLTQCIGCGCLSIDKCRWANPADQAGRRDAQEVAGHRACKRAADRDLALLGTNKIAGEPKGDRKHAAVYRL